MTRTQVALIAGLLALTLVASGCGDDDSTATTVADSGLLAEGEALYQDDCASCHGSDLRGTDEGPSHLSSVYEPNHHGDEAFRSAVANGSPQHHWQFGDMDPVPSLSEEDVDAIIAFVRDTQQREGFEE